MRCKSFHSASIQFWKWDAFFWRWEVEDILQAYWSKDNLLKLRAGSSSSDLVRYTSKESPYTARDVTRSSHIRTLPSSSKSQFFSSLIGFTESVLSPFYLKNASLIFWTLNTTISSTFYCNRSDFKMQRIPLVGLNLAFLREAHSRRKSKWKSFKNFLTATLLLKLFTGFRNEKKSENSFDKFNKQSKDFPAYSL